MLARVCIILLSAVVGFLVVDRLVNKLENELSLCEETLASCVSYWAECEVENHGVPTHVYLR